jgi:hypothetical protein
MSCKKKKQNKQRNKQNKQNEEKKQKPVVEPVNVSSVKCFCGCIMFVDHQVDGHMDMGRNKQKRENNV